MNADLEFQRIDKWLWHARFVKTRSLAQKLVTSGKVRIDSEKITSANKKIRVSNVLTIAIQREIKIIEITGIPQRRGPYSEAQTFYKDLTPPSEIAPRDSKLKKVKSTEARTPRPTKHQRKQILALKHNSNG